MTERLTLTVAEAARLLGISRGACYEAIRVGQVPSIRIGRRVLVPRARFEAFDGNRHTRDGVHPNRVGEAIMAAAWFDALHEISNRRSRLGPKDSPEH